MYSLVRHLGFRDTLKREAPAGVIAIVIAELLYKFHSFTLECAAFLGTWFLASFVLSSIATAVANLSRKTA